MTQPDHYPAPQTWHETKTLQHRMQRDLLRRAWAETGGDRPAAARSLGMTLNAFWEAARRLGIDFGEDA